MPKFFALPVIKLSPNVDSWGKLTPIFSVPDKSWLFFFYSQLTFQITFLKIEFSQWAKPLILSINKSVASSRITDDIIWINKET